MCSANFQPTQKSTRMKTKFRVLLIDDTKEVLDYLQAILEQDISVSGLSIKIQVETLLVELEPSVTVVNAYQINEQTIMNLGINCSDKFDYIFSDFGFIGDRTRAEALRQHLLNGQSRGVIEADIKGLLLQLRDIKTKYDDMCTRNVINNVMQNSINANFLKHEGSILVYTNSPKPFDNYFDNNEMPIRMNEVKNTFKDSDKVDFILMHNEFSITPELENLFSVDVRKKFYSQLLSKRINSLMQYVALEHMVASQDKLRIRKTDKAFKVLTAWAIGFGAAVAVFGEVLFHFAHETLSLAMEKLNLEFDTNLWLNLGVTILLILLSWKLFSKMGLKFSEKTEQEVEKLTQINNGK